MTNQARKTTTVLSIVGFVLAGVVLIGILLTGFVVIQPIGALPGGGTIWYFRVGTGLPFIQSPDGHSLDTTGSLSLFSRMTAMSALLDVAESRIIARLNYSDWMYLRSTGGRRFEE